jgi:beta-aspartyl-peptidase (threonine type)
MSSASKATQVTGSWGADGGDWAVLVHGGAGDLHVDRDAERAETQKAGCLAAARAASSVLRAGGGALDAVERAVEILEADPCFNAGTGACLNAEGLVELDAAIMEGSALRAGAVCALPPFLHPIAIARAVLTDGRHVLYASEGAARFAVEHGFTRASNEAMTTDSARARWAAAGGQGTGDGWGGGTVGAVARDASGTVAAATSTGGLVHKRVGRVGDSPLLGAGTYADNDGGACSATGQGEAIMRIVLAKAACDSMRARVHPEEAARSVIRTLGVRMGATGGTILVDREGRVGWARNTLTMAWAAAGEALDEIAGV